MQWNGIPKQGSNGICFAFKKVMPHPGIPLPELVSVSTPASLPSTVTVQLRQEGSLPPPFNPLPNPIESASVYCF